MTTSRQPVNLNNITGPSESEKGANLQKIITSKNKDDGDADNSLSLLNMGKNSQNSDIDIDNDIDNDYIRDDDYQAKFNSDFRRHKRFLIGMIIVLSIGVIVTSIMTSLYYQYNKECEENPSMGRPHFTCPNGKIATWIKPDGTTENFNNIFY